MFYSTGSEFKVHDLLLPSSKQMEFADYGSVWGGHLVQNSNTSLYLVTKTGSEAMHRENRNSAASTKVQQPAKVVPVQWLHVLEEAASQAVTSQNAAAAGKEASRLVATGACWIRRCRDPLGSRQWQSQVPNEQEMSNLKGSLRITQTLLEKDALEI